MSIETFSPSVVSDGKWWLDHVRSGARFRYGPSKIIRRATLSHASIDVDDGDEMVAAVTLSEGYPVASMANGHPVRRSGRIGLISFFVPGQPVRLNVVGPARYLILNLSLAKVRSYLDSAFEIDGPAFEFQTMFHIHDPDLERLFYRLAIVQDEEADELLCKAVGYLVSHYTASGAAEIAEPPKAGLSPKRFRNVCDLIEAELATDLPLGLLAKTAELSAFHFAREFRAMTGLSPHQYVIRRRIDRALGLLAQPRIPVEEVSRQAGFYRASHLSRHMQRLIGVTPRIFRSKILV